MMKKELSLLTLGHKNGMIFLMPFVLTILLPSLRFISLFFLLV
nr:MAG TPA: hypothetical protein [Caudoviricetes sp.]